MLGLGQLSAFARHLTLTMPVIFLRGKASKAVSYDTSMHIQDQADPHLNFIGAQQEPAGIVQSILKGDPAAYNT